MTVSSKDVGAAGHPGIAVGAVIVDKSQVLLVKHHTSKKGFYSGMWICPGGRLELGETLEEAARREVLEETGLKIEVESGPIVFERIVKDSSGETTLHVVYIDFLATTKGDSTPNAGSDVGEARWFPIEDIPWKELHADTAILLKKALGATSHPE
ncbi:MAG: NUDIX hydrolase [Candidatus Heimdallarchaeota archaeon]